MTDVPLPLSVKFFFTSWLFVKKKISITTTNIYVHMTDVSLPLSVKFGTAGLGGIAGWWYVFIPFFKQKKFEKKKRRRYDVRRLSLQYVLETAIPIFRVFCICAFNER